MSYNGWVYEQVCLAECFKLPILLMANLLIYRVSCWRDYSALKFNWNTKESFLKMRSDGKNKFI